jgi:hypothetical protein
VTKEQSGKDTEKRVLHILNLGAGVQSTTLYLMSVAGVEPGEVPAFDYAVFADTQEEPDEVYKHLDWLRSLGGPPILTGTAGKLGDDLTRGVNSTGQRFASIPAYTSDEEGGDEGQTKRQCTSEYKIGVIEQVIRRQILGLDKGDRVPKKAVHVNQYIGLSFDEPRRRAKVMARYHAHPWASCHFPLFDLFMTRTDCREWLASQAIPHRVPRSACVFCPYHDNAEWRRLRDTDPSAWQRAVEIDDGLRRDGAIVNRGLDQKLYVHRSCVPLSRADIDTPEPKHVRQRFSFSRLGVEEQECEGVCGN